MEVSLDGLMCANRYRYWGRILFLIFVHDLPEWVKNSMMMFARIQKLEDKDSLYSTI